MSIAPERAYTSPLPNPLDFLIEAISVEPMDGLGDGQQINGRALERGLLRTRLNVGHSRVPEGVSELIRAGICCHYVLEIS